MATVYLPDVRKTVSRLAAGKNTNGDDVASSLQDWSASFQKGAPGFSWNRARGFCLSAAMCYPISDQRRLAVMTQWLIIIFVWDDILDDPEEDNLMDDASGAHRINRLMTSVFDHHEITEKQAGVPIVAAFHAFWAGFRATSGPSVQQRFADSVRQYAQAAADLVSNREKRRSPAVDEFVLMRRATSGVETCFACVENCLAIEVPDEAFYHREMQELRDALNDVIAWTNDLYSFNKEQAAGDYQNLVAVVAIERNLDVQSAIQFVFTMIQSAVDRYFEAKARMPKFSPETDELVSRYINGLDGLVRWHFEVDRYFGSKVSELVYHFQVKLLPSKNHALDPGFRLKYHTRPILPASQAHDETTSNGSHAAGPESSLWLRLYDRLRSGVWH